LAAAEAEIDRLEKRLNDLSHALGVATADADVPALARLGADYQATQERLEAAYTEWASLSEAVMQAEATA
jgi:uncharacterized protein YPO0396